MSTEDETPTSGTGPEVAEPVPPSETEANVATPPGNAHPYRERYVLPFVFPLMIVIGVIFYILNVSRLFLATKGTTALVIASVITALILFGGAALSSAPKMRSSSLGIILVGALVVLGFGGFTVIGHSEEHKAAKIVLGPPTDSMEITVPAGQLAFSANKKQVAYNAAGPYSVVQVSYHDAGAAQHTLQFDDPTVVWSLLEINNAGETKVEDAGFPKAGTYTYFCTIPGHRAAGMQGSVTVTAAVKPAKVAASKTTPSS
jgi:plastocyanin